MLSDTHFDKIRTAKANKKEFELQQNIDHISMKFKMIRKQNEGLKMKVNQQKSSRQQTEKYNLRYMQKLSVIRKFCRSIIREIKSNKNEIDHIKSSVAMDLERIFHEIQSSFIYIESKSARFILKNENGMKMKLESMEQQLLSTRNDDKLGIEQLQSEVNTIKNNLAEAKTALSPKKIHFNKISLTSSLDSSLLAINLSKRCSAKKARKPSSFMRESCETATIRKLRNDLQSLECNYAHSTTKKES